MPNALDELFNWMRDDKKTAQRIESLLREIMRDPFKGIGKTEPLKGNLQGKWSRRITDEHRLIYEVTDKDIIVLSCKGHYN
jgi:toxin YoeB